MYGFYLIFGVCALLFEQISSSAIPMWEYLSKDEKMSYLYSMFANQVDDYCGSAKMRNCNRELLKFGLNKLKEMPEDHLDTMDPYQRGANSIIWDSMMEGHASMRPSRSSTAKPNSYEDDSFADFGTQTAASARIETIVRPPKFPLSPLYRRTTTQRPATEDDLQDTEEAHLSGPMVIRVHPDGTPVQETVALPQDEDLRHYQLSKVKLPDF